MTVVAAALTIMAVGMSGAPHGEWSFPLLAAAVIFVTMGIIYCQFAGAMPRTGGDYLFGSRIIHPIYGCMAAGVVTVLMLLNLAQGITVWWQMSFSFRALGSALGSQAITDFASTAGEPRWTFVFGVIIIVICTVFLIIGSKLATSAMFWASVITIAGIAMGGVYMAFTSSATFIELLDQAAGAGAYQSVLTTAADQGFVPYFSMRDVMVLLPFGFLMITYSTATYPAGEIKRPGMSVWRGGVVAATIFAVVVVGVWLAYRTMVSIDFVRSASYLVGVGNYPTTASDAIQAVQANEAMLLVAKDPITKIVLALAFPLQAFAFNMLCMLVLIRLMFALSFDRLLPSVVSSVSSRTHTPVLGTIIIAIVACAFGALACFSSALAQWLVATSFLWVFLGIEVCIMAIVFPFRRRDMYVNAPKPFGVERVPLVSVVGGVMLAVFIVLLVIMLGSPLYRGTLTTTTWIVLGVSLVWGPILYLVSRQIFKAKGVDLRAALRELSPD